MMALFYVGCGVSLIAAGARPQSDRAGARAHGARHVRRDLSSGRHRHADRAGDHARALARLQRRVRQSRRRVRGRDHGGAGGVARLARGLPGAGRDLPCDRARLSAARSGRRPQGRRPHHRRPTFALAAWMAATIFGLFIDRSRSPPASCSTSPPWRCRRSSTSGSARCAAAPGRRARDHDLHVRRARAARGRPAGREISRSTFCSP